MSSPHSTHQNQETLFDFIPSQYVKWVLAVLAVILYINTTGNKYALDDIPVVKENRYVLQGVDGIKKILSSDMFASMYEDYNAEEQLSGGRYRPLSMVTFAIEYQLFGSNPAISHFINALLYALIAVLLYHLLSTCFHINTNAVVISVLLFVIHPVHTEVVANIKSRDELLSFLFILTSMIFSFKYIEKQQLSSLIWTGFSFFLAYLSKEYALTLLVLIPLAAYVFYPDLDRKKLVTLTSILIAVTIVYIFIRIGAVGLNIIKQNDILNNPYLYASSNQEMATKLIVLLKYLQLLIWPHPLSSDYSYNSIPYVSFGNPLVWLSAFIYVTIIYFAISGSSRKKPWGFALTWYLCFLFPVSNLAFDIGATMGERLVFHASFGFCLFIGLSYTALTKIPHKATNMALAVIVLVAGFKTMARNKDWRDSDTLFLKDIHTVPNSILVNNNVAEALINRADTVSDFDKKAVLIKTARSHTEKALLIYPRFTNGLLNHALTFEMLGQTDTAIKYWMIAKSILPNDPHFIKLSEFYYKKGLNAGLNNVPQAISNFSISLKLYEQNANAWSDLGGAYYTQKLYDSALYCWKQALRIDPGNANAANGYRAVTQNRTK